MNARWLSRALLGVAALLWLTAAFLPSTTAGNGSVLSGHRLADLIASGALAASVPPWVGLAWYVVPICAAFLLMALGLSGTRGVALRLCAALPATASALGFSAAVSGLDISRVGTGLGCEVAGSACAIVASGMEGVRLARTAGGQRVL